jgi:hypothetical protein
VFNEVFNVHLYFVTMHLWSKKSCPVLRRLQQSRLLPFALPSF